jgi:hypothetical protein
MCRYNALCNILLIYAYRDEQALNHISVFSSSFPFMPLQPLPNT